MIEANTKLGYFTLPEEFFGQYKEIVKITAYDRIKAELGEDPRKAMKRDEI